MTGNNLFHAFLRFKPHTFLSISFPQPLFILLLPVVFSLSLNVLSGQQTGQCGTYVKETPYPVWYFPGDSSDTYFDRFGNLYSRDEITTAYHSNSHQANCINTGYFNLILEGNFTPQEEITICSVFNYLSTLITPQNANSFINIHIVKGAISNASTLGEGSPFWSTLECGIANSLVQEGLYGNTSGIGLDHGFIRINSSITWHTLNMDNTCPPNVVCPNLYDLYTVVLHEAFHVLGFASNITVNSMGQGVPLTGNIYSRWDSYLYSEIQDRFLLNKVTDNPECCDEHEFDNEHFPMPGTVNQVCASDIFFRTGGAGPTGINIAEVNSDALGASVPNILSHLPESCNNSGDYVMNPTLNTGTARRTPNPDEIEILCALGYMTSGSCTAACTVSIGDDSPIIVELNETLPLLSSTNFTANDIPQGGVFTFSPASPCNDYPVGMVNYDNQTGMFTVTGTQLGVYTFCYTYTGCDGAQCGEGSVTIVVTNPATNQCCLNNIGNCNINCLGNFETFTSEEELRLALTGFPNYFFFVNQTDNTPDFLFGNPLTSAFSCDGNSVSYPNTGGNVIRLVQSTPSVFEGVAFPLCEPVTIGKTVTVNFRATTTNACLPFNPRVILEFSEQAPVGGQVIYNIPGIDSPMPSPSIPIISTEQTNPVFGQYTFTFPPNNSGVEWNHLVLSFRKDGQSPQVDAGVVLIDDVEVIIDKKVEDIIEISTNVLPNTPCLNGVVTLQYQICNITDELSPATTFVANIPSGLNFVPTPDFPTTNIGFPAGWLLPNECKTISLAVKVDNNQALIGQTLPIELSVNAGDCYQDMTVTSNITPIENPLSISKTYTENTSTGVLTFTLDVSNNHIAPIGNVEVVDALPNELNIVNANGFTINGNVLTQIITIPALSHVQLTFTVIRDDPCACVNIQNCSIARIVGSGCGDVVDCIEIEGYSSVPDATFVFTNDPLNCHSVSFVALDNSVCATHTWDFGDGFVGAGANVVHNYANNGTYLVVHTVTNSCGSATTTGNVLINCEQDFSCACTTANSLNIDAGAGTNVSDIPALNNLPLVNGALALDLDQYGNCIAINGRLIVDKNLSILDALGNGESHIYMQPCSEIVVNGAKRLSMQSLDIEGCDIMWRGITVEPFGRLYFVDNRIADAQFAIKAIPSGPQGLIKPTTILVQRNRFERNHVGVFIEQGPPSNQLAHMPFAFNEFYSEVDQNLLEPCDGIANWNGQFGYAGIVALNQQFIVGMNNTFDKLRNGVIAENCDLEVQISRFLNISGTPGPTPSYASSEGIGILANGGAMTVGGCRFNKMHHAMYATDNPVEVIQNEVEAGTMLETHGSWGMKVEENNPVKFNDFGITAQDISPVWGADFSGYTVGNNRFYSNNTFFDLNDRWAIEFTNEFSTDPPNAVISDNYIEINDQVGGIQVSNINAWQMHYNEIRFLANPSAQDISASGIVLDNSTFNYLFENAVSDELYGATSPGLTTGYNVNMSTQNTYCCNRAQGPYTGFLFSGFCTNTDFRHNRTGVNANSLTCTDATRLSTQEDKGNEFLPGSGTATHNGSLLDIFESRFYVYDVNLNGLVDDVPYSPVVLATQNWFFTSALNAGSCEQDAGCQPPPHYPEFRGREVESNDIRVANNDFENTPRGQMLKWESSRNLFARMQQYSELHGVNSAVDAFFASATTGLLGQHYAIDETVRSVFDLPLWLTTQLQDIQDILATNNTAVETKLTQLSQVNTWPDSLAIYEQADSIRLLASEDMQEFLELMNEVEQLRWTKAALALPSINALPASNVLETNRKTAYKIYLTLVYQGVRRLTPAQFASVSAIAEQCPLEGGTGVFLARALYQYNDRKHFDDSWLCGGAQPREEVLRPASLQGGVGVKLAPNPATGVVNVLFDRLPIGQEIDIKLVNVTGQQVLMRSGIKDEVAQLDVSYLPDGLYFCIVNISGQPQQTAKLSIQH